MECNLCPALCASRRQIVQPTPCPVGGLLCIGEAPGETEDVQGFGFAGRAGKTLDAVLAEHCFYRGTDFGVANACRCRPPENRKPTSQEIANCKPLLFESIAAMQPSVLLLVGGSAVAAVLGEKTALFDLITKTPSIRLNANGHDCWAVAMPHVSPLAWNRFAPNGERWAEIGRRQVALAVSLVRENSLRPPSQSFRLT